MDTFGISDQEYNDSDGTDDNEENFDMSSRPAGMALDIRTTYSFDPTESYRLVMKKDHCLRPLWVCEDGRIILEAFSPLAKHAQDFLIAVAEPVSRPQLIHEFRITEYSLYAAVSVGLEPDSILDVLGRLSKCQIPEAICEFIKKHTSSYGKIKLVLKQNRYWVESREQEVLSTLLQDQQIAESRVVSDNDESVFVSSKALPEGYYFELPDIPQDLRINNNITQDINDANEIDLFDLFEEDIDMDILNEMERHEIAMESTALIEENGHDFTSEQINVTEDRAVDHVLQEELAPILNEDQEPADDTVKAFEIRKECLEQIKKRCSELSYPILEEYDFHQDEFNPTLKIDLKPTTKLRSYQEKSLGKMFGNGRARSGIIVLPCGSGKTLVGVTAACTIKKSCLVLCTSSVSVEQWAREFKFWTNAKYDQVARFTSDIKETFTGDAGVMISTYTMISFSGKRAYDAQKIMDFIQAREWGFLLLDEVHVVPAEMFRKVLTIVAAHAKLGLTATLVREDDKIRNLNYLIGPKLFEANWMELSQAGHIAKVSCAEVWCNMSPEFFREYLREKSRCRKRQLLYAMNPKKIQACQYLISYHEAMGDKILVFSDNVFALKHYASKLNKPYIYGGTSQSERIRVLQQFRFNPALNTIFISKVGDTSIDLPEANCLIQISSQYGSRRQEAQRLGRILRAKPGSDGQVNAYFYSLVSKDTEEMYYALKRQQFLIDQGYQFKILTNLEGIDMMEGAVYTTLMSRLELLNTVLISTEKDVDEVDVVGYDGLEDDEEEEHEAFTRRQGSSLMSLSGADSMAYMEYQKTSTSGLPRRGFRSGRG